MLTKKDYCDYDTCVALKELGFNEPTLAYYFGFLSSKPLLYLVIDKDCMPEDGVNVFDLLSNSNKYKDSKNIDAPTLWEAQKWLMEEKKIEVNATYDNIVELHWHWYMKSLTNRNQIISNTNHDSYEQALLAGIKETIKILKEK